MIVSVSSKFSDEVKRGITYKTWPDAFPNTIKIRIRINIQLRKSLKRLNHKSVVLYTAARIRKNMYSSTHTVIEVDACRCNSDMPFSSLTSSSSVDGKKTWFCPSGFLNRHKISVNVTRTTATS